MIVLQVLWLGIWLLLIPLWTGTLFAGVDNRIKKLPLLWISGQMLLWAGFQIICVPLVLAERSVTEVTMLYIAYVVVVLLWATVLYFHRRSRKGIHVVKEKRTAGNKRECIAWLGFWVLLLFQLIQAVVMTYGDGDDAFYIGEATHAVDSDTMYRRIPYTGMSTLLEVRYGLAPFPIWISFLSKISGVRTVSVAHVILPLVLISMTYGIYYLMGCKLFAKKRECIPMFLIFTELLVLFGDYSFYTVENFMIARSRQGKAALGNIMIPMLLLLLLLLLEKLQEAQKISLGYWVLLMAVLIASCLCSTLGSLLVCMLVGLVGVCAAISYRKWTVLIPMATCCVPCVLYAALYLVLG